ncbi:uncharacterized protein LOC142233439 [Haematobia irritans]|uniref:Putative secreted protein n=1 Tax=Haematobia irritans TaxID=7368 RepID=A0A1L8E9I5_HAEIR
MALKFKFGLLIVVISITEICLLKFAGAVCNECQENHVACVNQTSYYMCFGESIPNTSQLFTCPEGLVCTNLPTICFQRNTLPASCGDTSSCDICNSNQVFACTSRTTFSFCYGATTPSDVTGNCPLNTTCDASSPNFCVYELKATSIVCDRVDPSQASGFIDF